MNGNINFYGRARRIALYRTIAIVIGCIIITIMILSSVFKKTGTKVVVDEFAQLSDYFVSRGYSCEVLSISGGRCISNYDNVKTTFYRYDDGFEYVSKTDSYSIILIHRLKKEDEVSVKTTSSAFEGYRNQNYECSFDNNVLDGVEKCENDAGEVLDVKSYLGLIEQAQLDITNAINYSGYSLDNVLINYDWTKK